MAVCICVVRCSYGSGDASRVREAAFFTQDNGVCSTSRQHQGRDALHDMPQAAASVIVVSVLRRGGYVDVEQ